MKRWVVFMIAILACSMIAAAEEPMPSPDQLHQQMERIQNARRDLERQHDELERQRQDLQQQRLDMERQRDQLRPDRPLPREQIQPDRPMLREQMHPDRSQLLRDKAHKDSPKPLCALVMILCAVVHILVAVWVFQDIRKRGAGSGLWIVIALIAGLIGALVYAVVRLGDVKQ